MRAIILTVLSAGGLLLGGCVQGEVQMPQYEFTDLASGRAYHAIGPDINRTAGGVSFHDEGTGERIALTNFSEHRIEDARCKGTHNLMTGEWQEVSVIGLASTKKQPD